LAPQDAFYSVAAASSRLSFGSAYKGFNDTLAIWGTNRFIYQGCGATWLATFNEISKFYSADHQLQGVQLVTWNDYEEGTAIESGVDNCVYLTPSISGATLNWAVAGGDQSTIDHYTVFISSDGQNLAKLADVPSGTHSLNLAQLKLARGTYVLFVKAVGRASFQNKMSPAISYLPGDQPPTASLAFTQTDVLTVRASSEASSDPDGSLTSSTLDFGDGTLVKGPTASHTYSVPGTYNLTATVFDNSGSSAVAMTRTSVKPATPGVTIFAPTNGAVVNWPTSLVASATLPNSVTLMEVMIDGQLVYRIDRDTINAALKIFRGTHQVQVQAFDSTGAVATSSLTVTAEPGDLTPTANVSVLPLPAISPNTVLVCTANSNDPDGFFIARKMQFSDGGTTYGTAAVHTFAAPGTYSVTATVTDQFGVPASASDTFVVGH
jgi:PKD repeat protein